MYGLPTPSYDTDCFEFAEHKAGGRHEEQSDADDIADTSEIPDPRPDPFPEVSQLNFNTFTSHDDMVSAIVESMKRSGGCVIRDLISREALARMESEIRPFLDQVKQADPTRESFVPSNTRMVTGLLSKSWTYATEIVGNKTFQDVSSHFLTSALRGSWHGEHARTSVSKPQLSTTITFCVPPGTPAQGLHRDDDIYHTWHPECTEHHSGRDTMVCFFVAGSNCTAENGATRIVPGSHLWDYWRAPPAEDEGHKFFRAEMKPGDVFMMLGGVYHGAGQNRTAASERLVHAAFATRGYLRQEENQYLANDLEKIRQLPETIQRFAGFGVSKPYMGWVELEDPVSIVLGGSNGQLGHDFW